MKKLNQEQIDVVTELSYLYEKLSDSGGLTDDEYYEYENLKIAAGDFLPIR